MESNEKDQTTSPPCQETPEQLAKGPPVEEAEEIEQTEGIDDTKGINTEKTKKVEIEAYWVERKRYLQEIQKIPELRRRYIKAGLVYLMRRFLWSFAFFPVFISFWVPLVLNRFNFVATIKRVLPSLQAFVEANPQSQAATVETLIIAWFSVGMTFAIFDFILSPFKNPYAYEADVHMRSWETLHLQGKL